MKKCKKLLSVLLAAIMMLSCFSVMGYAFEDYTITNTSEYYYDSNDNPRVYLYTAEQRSSIAMDTVDNLLGSLNIKVTVVGISIDLTSYDALCDTLDNWLISTALNLGGDIADLEHDMLDGNTRSDLGDVAAVESLLYFAQKNADVVYELLVDGIDLGTIGSLAGIDFTGINEIVDNLVDFLGGVIYGLGDRQLTNGIGEDPNYPNDELWENISTDTKNSNYKIDNMLENLVENLLTTPRNTVRITDPAQNTLGEQAIAELQEDGVTYNYYCYGVETAEDGTQTLITTYEGEEPYRHYLTCWDESSSLLKGVSATNFKNAFDLTDRDLYTLLEGLLGWAYDAFAGHNLDGQLRATLMQYCGAFNEAETDETIQGYLQAIVNDYKAKEEKADFDKSVLQTEFKKTDGAAGNYNFMYIALNDDGTVDTTANINTKPDNLYYVVEWGGSWEYYHVVFDDYMSTFFDLIDWEYQAPTWSELTTKIGWEKGTSLLQHINNIVGTIITTAVNGTATVENEDGTTTNYSLKWTSGTDEGLLATNVTALIKLIIKADTRKLFGSTYSLPENFDNFSLEQVVVELARILVPKLMPALVLPDDVASVEEVLALCLREVMADILPETGESWDSALEKAVSEDDYLDIALSMGCSVGVYYLVHLIGLGTSTDGAKTTSTVDVSSYLDAGTPWKTKLGYIINWVVSTYVPNLTKNSGYSSDTVYSDPLGELSKIFSTIAPSLLKILGANTDSYALDLNHVYADLRLALNGDFSELGKGLLRKSSGTSANYSAIKAIGTFITELFGGLGMNVSGSDWASDWSTLSGKFTTAYESDTPIQTLVGNYGVDTTLASLAQYLVSTLMYCRDYWWADALKFILMLTGRESGLSNTGLAVDGVEQSYTGATSFTIDYTMGMTTKGVLEYFNDGNYKSGTGYFDGDYYIYIESATVTAGTTTYGTATYKQTLAANEVADLAITFSNVGETPKAYTLKVAYKIQSPAQNDFSASETLYYEETFIATSLSNDSLTPVVTTMTTEDEYKTSTSWTTGVGSSAVTYNTAVYFYGVWNISTTNTYISENESLNKAGESIFTLTDNSYEVLDGASGPTPSHTWSNVYVEDYGYNITADDGSISINSAEDGSGDAVDLSEIVVIKENGETIDAQDAWFKWNVNSGTLNTDGVSGSTTSFGTAVNFTGSDKMWAVETDGTYTRSSFEDDFTTYEITLPLSFNFNMTQCGKNLLGTAYSQDDAVTFSQAPAGNFTSYITVYNSYDLAAVIDSAIALKADDYDTTEGATEWATLQSAIDYAMTTMYGEWQSANFATKYTLNVADITVPVDGNGVAYEGYDAETVSQFKLAADKLDAAMNAVAEFKLEDAVAEATVLDPSDANSPYHATYATLKEMQAADTSNHNYLLYTWYRYNDVYQSVKNAITALTVPASTAPNTLVGVTSDNDQITKAIAAIDNDGLEAIVSGLVQAPTAEASQAAADTYYWFEQGYDALTAQYDAASLAASAATMKIYGTNNEKVTVSNQGRLLPKYSSQQMYFLNDAITTYGNEAAADYSEGSYAVYFERLEEAKTVQADSAATQYDIFSARYNLLVAYKALIPAGDEINVTTNGESGTETDGLKALYAQAQEIFEAISDSTVACTVDLNEDGTIDEADDKLAYEQLVWAAGVPATTTDEYGNEVTYYIGGEYTGAYALSQEGLLLSIKKQGWIDEITVRIDDALANFEVAAEEMEPSTLMVEEGFEYADYVVIDTENNNYGEFTGIIYGIDTLDQNEMMEVLATLDDALTTNNGDDYLVITENENGVESTGAIIEVVDENGDVLETYVFVYFGDIDGDGMISANDALIAEWYETAYEGIETYAAYVAADVDGDGMPSANDALIAEWYETAYEGVDYQYNLGQNAVNNMYEWIF